MGGFPFQHVLVLALLFLMEAGFIHAALAAPPAVDPCKLVTASEVALVIGKVKGAPRVETGGESVKCIYELVDGMDELEIWVAGDYALESFRKDAKKPIAVKGLGDEAFIDRGKVDIPMVQLYIKKGSTMLMLILGECPGDEEKLKAIGRKALGRL